jgi:hypothetical protein
MKKILFIAAMLFAVNVMYANRITEVSEKVLKAFKETFKDVKDVTWYEEGDKSYRASFIKDEIKIRVRYDEDGNLLSTIRYYGVQTLPFHIQMKLQKKFADKNVFGVTEMSSDDMIEYHITLQDEKRWYTVKSDANGNFEVTEKFKKA